MARLRIRSMMAERVAGRIAATDRPAWLFALGGLLGASLVIHADRLGPAVGAAGTLGLHLPVILGAWAAARRLLGRRADHAAAAVDGLLAGLIYFAGVIGLATLLGFLGVLTRPAFLAGMAVLGLMLLWLGRGHATMAAWRPARPPRPAPASAGARTEQVLAAVTIGSRLATVAFVLVGLFQCIAAPEYVYDVLNYHLTFAASWVQTGMVSIVPTWFGDPAPAYAPSAMEVYFATLLLPAGGDVFARCGQFPSYLLLLAAIATLARALRTPRVAGAALVMIVAGLPGIAAQASTAMVDVALAAWLCAAATFALRLCRSRSPADAVGLLLATGLAGGTKFVAIVFLAALAPLIARSLWCYLESGASGLRRPAGAPAATGMRVARGAVCAALLTGLWIGGAWYVRNWLLTGNPVYPARVEMAGVTLFDGAFGREQMENHIMNARRGGDLLPLARVLWQSLSFGARGDILSPVLAAGPAWLGAGLLGVLGALLARGSCRALFGANCPRGAAQLVLGGVAALALFWWGLPVQDFRYAWGPLLWTMAIAALSSRCGRFAAAATGVAALALSAIVFNAAIHRFAQCWLVRGDARERTLDSRRWEAVAPAWRYIDMEVHGKTIAYSGNNIPYFLFGRRLENRVVYVPARRPRLARFDQWARLPESRALGAPQTSEPTFDRWVMDPTAWIENLRELGVEYFVVNSLDLCPNLSLNVRHDADGFPVERAWLDALARAGAAERISFADPRVRVYRLHLDAIDRLPAGMVPIKQEETDALYRARKAKLAPAQPIPDYPLAGPYIERYRLRSVSGA